MVNYKNFRAVVMAKWRGKSLRILEVHSSNPLIAKKLSKKFIYMALLLEKTQN